MPDDIFSRTERRFIKKYVQPRAGRTLIVGSYVTDGKEDRRLLYRDVVGVDMRPGPGVDIVADMEESQHFLGKFDHIECLSVLEHSRRPWWLAQNLEHLLVAGGTLHVSAPFVWRFHDYPSDYWRFTAEGMRSLFTTIDWQTVMYASDRLRPDHYLQAVDVGLHPHLPKTAVMAFGIRM